MGIFDFSRQVLRKRNSLRGHIRIIN